MQLNSHTQAQPGNLRLPAFAISHLYFFEFTFWAGSVGGARFAFHCSFVYSFWLMNKTNISEKSPPASIIVNNDNFFNE
jgi:hypothetical protein